MSFPSRLSFALPSLFSAYKYIVVVAFSEAENKFSLAIFDVRKKTQPHLFFAWERKLQGEESPLDVFPSLMELLEKKAGVPFRDSKFVFLVPERYIVLRRISLPKVRGKELASAVVLNVKRKLPARLEDLSYGFYVATVGQKKQDVVFYGVFNSYIERIIPKSWIGRLLFCPRDLTFWTIVVYSGKMPSEGVFCILYPAGNKFVISLSDRHSNLLVKEISSLKQLELELTLIAEYYKKTNRDAMLEDKIPLVSILEKESDIPTGDQLDIRGFLPSAPSIEGINDVSFLVSAYGAVLALVYYGLPLVESKALMESRFSASKAIQIPALDLLESWFKSIPEEIFIYIVLLAILVGGGYWAYHYQRYETIRKKYNKLIATLPKDVFPDPGGISQRDIDGKQRYFEREIEVFSSYLENKKGVYKVLEVIKKRFGGSFWLKLPFRLKLDIGTGKIQLTLTGGVYLGDPEEEIKALEELIENLRKDLKGYFDDIELSYFRRERENDKEYLAFSLRCE